MKMKKNKILTGAIIGIVVVILAIIAAMFATGKFKELKESFEPQTTAPFTETTTQIIPVSGRPKSAQPASIVAAVFSDYSENGTEKLSKFAEQGFNTVIFDMNEQNAATVAGLFEAAKANALYFGIRADISENYDYVTAFTEEFNFYFVILGGRDETLDGYVSDLDGICTKIKEKDSAMLIGIEPIYTSKASKSVTALTALGKADFVFLRHSKGKDSAFEAAQTVWNEKTSPLWLCHDLSGLSSFSTEEAEKMIAVIAQSADMSLCKALAFAPYSDISSASGTAAEIVLNYIQKRDTYLLDKEFSVTNHKKTDITVEQSTITFRGTSSPAYDLLCNGQKLKVAKTGDFSVDCDLNAGKNTVKFEHKGKTYTYTVTYKIKLLKSVSPSSDISVPGEMMIEFSAVALKKANVSVSFNGKSYPMSLSQGGEDEENTPDTESDFATFTATVTAPKSTASVQNLGKYKVTAKYSGLTESLSGAKVSVAAKEVAAPPPPTTKPTTTEATTEKPTETSSVSGGTQTDSSAGSASETAGNSETTTEEKPTVSDADMLQRYYYTENYGLGSAKICEIIDDYVETYPGNTTSTFSVPDCSPLLRGTVDYVNSTSTFDDETYYILASGVKVPLLREERLASGSEGKVIHVSIKDGYVMPKNSIKVVSCKTANGETVITLDMNRPVAFNAKLIGQTYGSYNGRPVTVSNLNCTGLELTFSDTENAEGKISVSNSVCTGGKWTGNKDKATVTLTLELAQKGKFYGFHYEYTDSGLLVISFKHKPSSSLNGYTIMLDPGHGGVDPGAICAVSSASFGQEKQINLSIATKVKELLEAEGAKVVMTRTGDDWVCYTDRNNAVRKHNPDMFIAIHCDSSTSASAMGTSAYYYRAYSQPLAKAVHNSIVNAYKTEIYKDEAQSVKDKVSRGAGFYAFRVTRVEECPAILIEYGFVSNTDECQILQTAQNRDILAAATVEGIKNYISAS